MGNRYTKTAFTARQTNRLKSMQYDLQRILESRMDKQDNPQSLLALSKAIDEITRARNEAESWVKR